jgi:hypothetical protein
MQLVNPVEQNYYSLRGYCCKSVLNLRVKTYQRSNLEYFESNKLVICELQ